MGLFSNHMNSIHVAHHKDTAGSAIVQMPVPEKVYISMSQHIGKPCQPVVAKGDHVKVGQLIGDVDAFISAPIYSSVSGDVVAIEEARSALGGIDKYVIIAADGQQEPYEGLAVPQCETRDDFIKAVRASGVVGLGGASFPTHVKLNPANIDECDTLIVNGAECEPFITSDHRNMLEHTDDIVSGIKLIMKYLDLKKCYIGIENNKPDAIAKMRDAVKDIPGAEVTELRSTYPQGAERVLIHETAGKTLNAGELPASVGCILSNVTTILKIGEYFRTGMPMISRTVTVAGDAIAKPANVNTLIGTKYYDLAEFCGGYKAEPKKIIAGGPMMGKAMFSLDVPAVKGLSALLCMTHDEVQDWKPSACIRCGRCVDVCPGRIVPSDLAKYAEHGNIDAFLKHDGMECCECGCCSYVCPAKRHLTQTIAGTRKNILASKKK